MDRRIKFFSVKKCKPLFVLVFFVLGFYFVTNAQKSTSAILLSLDSLYRVNFQQLIKTQEPVHTTDFINYLTSKSKDVSLNINNKAALIEAKKSLLKSDIGVNINGNYVENLNAANFSFDDNLAMQRRLQAGFEWELLKGGISESRAKAKALDYQILIDNQLLQSSSNRELYLKRFNVALQVFNQQKMNVLQKRKDVMQQLIENEELLFYKKQLKKEDLLESQKRISEVDAFSQVYGPYNQYSPWKVNENEFNKTIPAFDINYAAVFDKLNLQVNDTIKNYLTKEIEWNSKWYNEISLSTFARYHYYDMVSPSVDRSFMSVGVNFSIPLHFVGKRKKTVQALEIEEKLNAEAAKQELFQEELLNDMYEFRYKLHQFISFYYKRQTFEEQLRLEDTKRTMHYTHFSPIRALKLMDDLYAIEMELLELKQNMYIKLLRIQDKVPQLDLEELVKPIEMTHLFDKSKKSKRSMYVWTSIFENHTVSYIYQYLKYNQVDNVLLAYQKEDPYAKQKNELMQRLSKDSCKVELMVGQNNLLFETNLSKWFSKAFSLYDMKYVSGVHLDVEPHTMKEWKDQKDELLRRYVQFVHGVDAICNQNALKLSVSIPLHYPKVVVDSLYSIVDEVYFMCYENIDMSHLERKLMPYAPFAKQTQVALRIEDFKSRDELEKYIEALKEKLPFEKIVIHDLKRLIELDEREFKK
jgi:hypothetical protein